MNDELFFILLSQVFLQVMQHLVKNYETLMF